MERTPAATEGPAELLDRLAALAELLEAIFPKLELGLTGMSRHRVDSPANCIMKVQERKKLTTQIRDMTPKSKTQLCTLTEVPCTQKVDAVDRS
jgi:hypothetical protein